MTHKPRLLRLSGTGSPACEKLSKLEILCDQLVDSLIVGGISGISAYVAAGDSAVLKVFLVAFGLTFLVKMKEYRKIKD